MKEHCLTYNVQNETRNETWELGIDVVSCLKGANMDIGDEVCVSKFYDLRSFVCLFVSLNRRLF